MDKAIQEKFTPQKKILLLEKALYTVEPLSADTPEIRTSTVLRTVREVPNEIPFTYIYLTPLKADTSLFRIADMRSCPNRYLIL